MAWTAASGISLLISGNSRWSGSRGICGNPATSTSGIMLAASLSLVVRTELGITTAGEGAVGRRVKGGGADKSLSGKKNKVSGGKKKER